MFGGGGLSHEVQTAPAAQEHQQFDNKQSPCEVEWRQFVEWCVFL